MRIVVFLAVGKPKELGRSLGVIVGNGTWVLDAKPSAEEVEIAVEEYGYDSLQGRDQGMNNRNNKMVNSHR